MQQIIREEKWNEKPGSSGGKFECFPGSDGDIPENGDAAVAGDGGAGRGGGVVAVRRGWCCDEGVVLVSCGGGMDVASLLGCGVRRSG